MDFNDRLEKDKEKYANIEEGNWYTIEEARKITHKKIRERYADINRRTSNG